MSEFQIEILHFLYFALLGSISLAKIALYVFLVLKLVDFIQDTYKEIKKWDDTLRKD